MVKRTFSVTLSSSDLNLLDCYLVCSPLCLKHKKHLLDAEDELVVDIAAQTCRACRALRQRWWNASWRVCGALFEAFYPDKKRAVK